MASTGICCARSVKYGADRPFLDLPEDAFMVLVCIVDDDDSIRKSLGNLLKSMGYASVGFASGEAFLASAVIDQASCVLLDLYMHGMQGLEVQQCLNESGKAIAVICMSAHNDEDSIARAMAAGARCFLRKPFSEDILLSAITQAVLHR